MVGLFLSPPKIAAQQNNSVANGIFTVTTVPVRTTAGYVLNLQDHQLKLLAFSKEANPPLLGDQVKVTAPIKPIKKHINQARMQGLSGQVSLTSRDSHVVASGSKINADEYSFAEKIRAFIDQDIGGRDGALMAGLAFNDSSYLSQADKLELQSTGCMFLIAASGLHLFVFQALFMSLFLPHLVPRALRLALFGIFIVVYTGATGYHAATVRAGLMTIIAASAYLWNRKYDGLSALSLAGLFYLAWQPSSLFSPGFQLSMLAVTTLVLGNEVTPAGKWQSALTSFWGWVGSTPIGAFWFKTASWIGPVACLLPILLLTPTIVLCLLDYLIHSLVPVLAVPLSLSIKALASIMWKWLDFCSAIPYSSTDLQRVSGYWLVLLYGTLFAWLISSRKRRQSN